MRRRNIEEKGERIQVSLKLPKEVLDRIDESWKSGEIYTGRSHYIEEACKHYLDCVPCPNCGSLNSSASKICSICEYKLLPYQELLGIIREEVSIFDKIHERIIALKSEYDDLHGKITWLLEKIVSEDNKNIPNVGELFALFLNSHKKYSKSISTYLEYYNIYALQGSSQSPLNLLMEKFPERDFTHLNGVGNFADLMYSFNDVFYDIRYSTLHFEYQSAKIILSNPNLASYSKLQELHKLLIEDRRAVLIVNMEMEEGLNELKTAEKMVDVLTKSGISDAA